MKDLLAEEALTQTAAAIIVTDEGFRVDEPDAATEQVVLDLSPESDLTGLADQLESLTFVRIGFPSFADGRGFTLARRLRQMGYTGRLRAAGHVLADQYAMARRCGFDDVEIDAALAARQPEDQWRDRANWQAHDHRSRLMAV